MVLPLAPTVFVGPTNSYCSEFEPVHRARHRKLYFRSPPPAPNPRAADVHSPYCHPADPLHQTGADGFLAASLLSWGSWGLAIVALALAFSYHGADPDLWGHVQYGRDAWATGLPNTATYTYTAEGHRWINHEHGSELLFAWLIDHGGVWALLVLKTLLGLGVLSLVAWQARRERVGWPVVTMTVVLVAGVLACYWPLRPQVISYTLFAVLIWLLTTAFSGWQSGWSWPNARPRLQQRRRTGSVRVHRWGRLWLVPVLFAFWANMHGAFVAGLAVFVVYMVLRGAELLRHRPTKQCGMPSDRERESMRTLHSNRGVVSALGHGQSVDRQVDASCDDRRSDRGPCCHARQSLRRRASRLAAAVVVGSATGNQRLALAPS